MKLSEAILLGSVSNKQAFGVLINRQGETCAMGAAMVGSGLRPEWQDDQLMRILYPILTQLNPVLPEGINWPAFYKRRPQSKTVREAIVILNNMYKWTRPQIAAWVATIEPQDEVVNGQDMLRLPQPDEAERSITNHA